MRLVLVALLALTVVGSASAMDIKGPLGISAQMDARYTVYCAGINADSGFYQNGGEFYGNVFSIATSAPLSTLAFNHYGWGFSGPYNYNVEVYDWTTCTAIGQVTGLVAQDAASTPADEVVDLCPTGMMVVGDVFVGIAPLTCNVPTDCYPDINFDYDLATPVPPVDGCGGIIDPASGTCSQIMASGLYPVDFLLSIVVDECAPATGACCDHATGNCTITEQAACGFDWLGAGSLCSAQTCVPPTPTETVNWGAIKALYR